MVRSPARLLVALLLAVTPPALAAPMAPSSSSPTPMPAPGSAPIPGGPASLTAPPPAEVVLAAPPATTLPVLTLDQAVNAAIAHQPLILQAIANEQAAEARVKEARAPLLPQIIATLSAQYSNPLFPGVIAGSRESLTPGVSISQTLFDYGAYYRWKAAQAAVDPLRASIEVNDETTVLNVRTAYFGVLAAEALVAVNQEQVDNQQKHVDQTQAFVEVGTHPKIDLVTAQVNLDNAKLALVQAQNAVRQAKVGLLVAMGVTSQGDFEVQQTELPSVPGETSTAADLLDSALKARPDVRQLDAQIRAQQLTVEADRVQTYFPTLSIQGQWGYLMNRTSESTTVSTCPAGDIPLSFGGGFGGGGKTQCLNLATRMFDMAGPPQQLSITNSTLGNQWSASATLSWPIYLGGATINTVKEQEANRGALVAQRESLALSVRSEIDADLIAIANDKQQIDLSESTVEQARQQRELAEGRYDAGVGNIIELGDAEAAVANAEGQLVKAKYSLASDRAKLAKALGE